MASASRFDKDPAAVLDWTFNWASWLASSETISSYTVTVPTGITKDSDSNTDTTVTAWLSGGTDDESYTIVCQIVTSDSRTDERSITINMFNR